MKDLAIPNNDAVLKNSVKNLYEANETFKKAESYLKEVKRKENVVISNYIYTNLPKDSSSFEIKLDNGLEYYTKHVNLRVTRVRTKKFLWDTKKLKKNLGNKLYRKVVDRTYSINDYEGLVNYLKECGVNPKKFLSFINIDESVNNNKVNELSEIGEITKKQIEGCYTLDISEPYIKLTKLE